MVEIVPFEAWHVEDLMDQFTGGQPQVIQVNSHFLENEGNAWTLLDDTGTILSCGGTIEQWPGRHQAWMYFSPSAGKYMRRITRFVQLVLEGIPGRIELEVIADFKLGHRWAKTLGFHVEAPRLEAYGLAGEDFVGYARINKVG